MRDQKYIEPGIFKTFRIFIGVRLALVLVSFVYLSIFTDRLYTQRISWLIGFVVLDATLLFLFLSISRFQTLLKTRYLPIAIIWATLGPMVQMYFGYFVSQHETIQITTYFMTPLPFLVLFIPLVIVAWQYSHRHVVFYCLVTLLVDCIFSLQVYSTSLISFLTLIGIATIRTILFLLVGNMITYLTHVQREQRMRLTETYNRLANYALTMEQLAISRERNRVARELHDVLAHTMSGVAVELEGVKTNLKINPDKADELLDHSLTALRQGLNETRQTLHGLRTTPVEEFDLPSSIRNLVESFPNKEDIHFNIQINDGLPRLPYETSHCFFRIAQEAINNIVTHSQAREVTILLDQQGSQLRMSIQDNGIGFDPLKVDQLSSYGLLGMRERAELLGAEFTLTSKPGSGTMIVLLYEV